MYIWLFLVPIASKALANIGNTANIQVFSHEFLITLSLPFSWKVFYFAAVFFTLATILFKFRCPRLIREHLTYESFNRDGKPEWHLMSYTEDVGLDFNVYKEAHKMNKYLYSVIEPDSENNTSSNAHGMFWELHRLSNGTRKFSFYTCLVFYIFGFMCIGWVFIENFIWVLRTLYIGT